MFKFLYKNNYNQVFYNNIFNLVNNYFVQILTILLTFFQLNCVTIIFLKYLPLFLINNLDILKFYNYYLFIFSVIHLNIFNDNYENNLIKSIPYQLIFNIYHTFITYQKKKIYLLFLNFLMLLNLLLIYDDFLYHLSNFLLLH